MKSYNISILILTALTMTACQLEEVMRGAACDGNTEGRIIKDYYTKEISKTNQINDNLIMETHHCIEAYAWCLQRDEEYYCSACPKGEQLVSGECRKVRSCSTDKDCKDNYYCIRKQCLYCKDDCICSKNTDCGEGRTCNNGICKSKTEATPKPDQECYNNTECSAGMVCTNGKCVADAAQKPDQECYNNTGCSAGKICTNGKCVVDAAPTNPQQGCASDADCKSGELCQNKQCVVKPASGCTQCPDGQVCKMNTCMRPSDECTLDSHCQSPLICKLNACMRNSDECTKNSHCGQGLQCLSGKCLGCISDKDCDDDEYCNAGTCKASYQYVKIDDLSEPSAYTFDAGADIDAVAVVREGVVIGYADMVESFLRKDNVDEFVFSYAADPDKAIWESDSIAGNVCKYFADDSDSIGNYRCDSSTGKEYDECDYDYTFVSLAGGYIVLSMEEPFKPGDIIRVYKLGDCNVTNTARGVKQNAQADEIKVSVAVDAEAANWVVLGTGKPTRGVVEFTVR